MTEFRPSRFEILPPVIKNLLIITGLVFLAQYTFRSSGTFSIEDLFALHAWQSELFKPWQLVTHLFMHSTHDFSHIFFNMLALWMFGAVLENVWGSKRFLTFYLICGLGAALMHLLVLSWEMMPMIRDYGNIVQQHAYGKNGESNAMIDFIRKYNLHFTGNIEENLTAMRANPDNSMLNGWAFENISSYYRENINAATIGASGAVFGVLAAFGYLFPNTYLYIYMLIPVKAKWFVLGYGAIELYQGIKNSAGDNVAHWAHLGGALVGLLIVITWNKTNKKTLY